MKLLPRVIIYGVLAIIVAVIIRMVFTGRPQVTVGTTRETTTIDTGDINITVNATGNIVANQDASLNFGTNGKVTAILVQPGDFVRKGQVIATVENTSAQDSLASAEQGVYSKELSLRQLTDPPRDVDVAVAQANLNMAQARAQESNVGVSASSVQISQDQVELAKNQLWQNQLSGDITNANREQLASNPRTSPQAGSLQTEAEVNASNDQSELGVQIAQANYQATTSQGGNYSAIVSAQASVTQAQIALNQLMAGADPKDIEQAQHNLDAAKAQLELAQANLAKTVLVAPFDGMVAQINLNVGESAPATNAVVMVDPSKFYLDLPVSEIDIASVKVGQQVDLHFDALVGQTIKGTVTHISDVATATAPVSYTVRVEIDPVVGQTLLAGMSTTAEIITSQASNVVRISNRFIRITGNQAFASVQQPDGTFQDVRIVLGQENDLYTEVKSGLKVGDVVAVPQATTTGGFGGAVPAGGGAAPAGGAPAGGPPGAGG